VGETLLSVLADVHVTFPPGTKWTPIFWLKRPTGMSRGAIWKLPALFDLRNKENTFAAGSWYWSPGCRLGHHRRTVSFRPTPLAKSCRINYALRSGWAVSRILDRSSWLSWSGRCLGRVVSEGLAWGAVAQV
jgi:hypothetical protein